MYYICIEQRTKIMTAIAEKVDKVSDFTVECIRQYKSIDVEKVTNELLDKILGYQDSFNSLNKQFENLNEDLISHYNPSNKLDNDDFTKMKHLHKSARELITVARASIYYKGIKSNLQEFASTITNYQEILSDIKLKFISLPKNEQFKSLMDEIKAL